MKTFLFVALGVPSAHRQDTRSGCLVLQFSGGYSWGTFVVNVVGSFLLGVLTACLTFSWSLSAELRAFLVVGVLGGVHHVLGFFFARRSFVHREGLYRFVGNLRNRYPGPIRRGTVCWIATDKGHSYMSGVQNCEVSAEDADIRVDRWFRRHFPGVEARKAREAPADRADSGRRRPGEIVDVAGRRTGPANTAPGV